MLISSALFFWYLRNSCLICTCVTWADWWVWVPSSAAKGNLAGCCPKCGTGTLLPLWWVWPCAVRVWGGDPADAGSCCGGLGPPLSWVGIGKSISLWLSAGLLFSQSFGQKAGFSRLFVICLSLGGFRLQAVLVPTYGYLGDKRKTQ